MDLHTLEHPQGAKRGTKRVGRGMGSGHGKTSTRGHKGQWSRSGGGVRPGFEGGQMPLTRRVPKRGFTNIFQKQYAIVNVGELNELAEGTVVSVESLLAMGRIKKAHDGLKILGRGEITTKIQVECTKISASAKEKIEACGGSVEVKA